MVAEVDVPARALADLNVVARGEFKFKPEQEVAVKISSGWKRCISGVTLRIQQKPHISNVCLCQGLCKMGLTSLHDFYSSWHLYICCSLFGHSTFLCGFTRAYEGQFMLCNKEEF